MKTEDHNFALEIMFYLNIGHKGFTYNWAYFVLRKDKFNSSEL
jgi:uncharacterized membrane protein